MDDDGFRAFVHSRLGRWSRVPGVLWIAIIAAAAGLLLTLVAAPIMLGLRNTLNPASLQGAFAGFWFWGNVRGICQLIAFVAAVTALMRAANRA